MGAQRRSGIAPSRVLFVTGKLAEPSLRRVLAEHEWPFAWDIAVLRITVAALMTTEWIAKQAMSPPDGTDLVMIPGLCEGSTEVLSSRLGVAVEKGPKDLREIPQFFGRAARAIDYGAYQVEILAEINNAPTMSRTDLRALAEYYRASGADVVDIGCTPGRPFPELADVVQELRGAGFQLSIDSFDPAEIATALDAGAVMVLSINSHNLDVAERYGGSDVRFVVIPDTGQPLAELERNLERLERWRVRYLIDPVIEPIGFGFMASLERYAEAHRLWPTVPQMMGIGNITELTAADTTGMHALLLAICEEVGVRAVLTTEVIPWARGAVREIDIARRLMHYAVTQKAVPKRVDDRLVTVKDPRILEYSEEELRALHAAVTDPNYRIFTDRDTITVFNSERFVRGTDIQQIFSQLEVNEATHAFYLGKELMKAKLAITLGKTYRQEGSLQWGYLTPEDDARAEHAPLTQRSRRSRNYQPPPS